MSRLDMSHGFVKYITKNQIDRDNFEKTRKAGRVGSTPNPKSRRPAQAVYSPPHRHRKDSTQADAGADHQERKEVNGAEANVCKKVLVLFKDHRGETHRLFVHKDDQLEVATKFCKEMGYESAYIGALAKRINQECAKYFTTSL